MIVSRSEEEPMAKKPPAQRYIIMPKQGFELPSLDEARLVPASQPVALAARAAATSAPSMRVLDSIRDTGPKLVEMPPEGELSLRLSNPELKIVPEVFYHRLWYRPAVERRYVRKATTSAAKVGRRKASRGKAGAKVKLAARATAAVPGSTITVVDAATGKPLAGAHLVAFTDYASRTGDQGDSRANGTVSLGTISPRQALERVYVYAPPGYWGYYATNTSTAALKTVKLRSIDITDTSLLLHQIYGSLPANAGAGVTVGIVDSGVDGTHPDLANVSGGLNCVGDEVRNDPAAAKNRGPAKTEGEHGTHVAGIIGGNGKTSGFRGVSPGVTMRSYRVFPDAGGGASNFDIAKAIDTATSDGCILINLSLGGGPADDLTKAAIDRALAAGVVVVAASGNDGRQPVSYPAAFAECVSISAMGRRKSFPAEAIGTSDIDNPSGGPNGNDFMADFSNIGSQIDATGPGVEIVSTLPGGQYGSMSGTSMATPAVTGFAAYLAGANAPVRQAQGPDRSRQLKDLIYASCKPEGFGRDYEGFGLPLP
jgi:subtilisin